MERNPSKKRVAKALDGFLPTLESFCKAALSRGRRTGNEWVVSDLQNSDDGTSCSVNLERGVFFDFNGGAKGGPLDLFGGIFGLTKLADIVNGIEAWVKNGTLPDGSKGVPRVTQVTLVSSGETLQARDRREKSLIELIDHHQEQIEWCKGFIDLPSEFTRIISAPWEPEVRKSVPDYYRDEIAKIERFIRAFKSQLYTLRWLKSVEETRADSANVAEFFAELRGLSADVFAWLIDSGYIALYSSEKNTRDGSRKWTDHEIAFPVTRDVHWRLERENGNGVPIAYPIETDIEFLGLHLKWFKTGGEGAGGWRYEPKGISSEPLVIGDLASAEDILIGESTWDIIAAVDVSGCYRWDTPWAAIATRGASNAHRVPVDKISSEATLVLVLQNDSGNENWCRKLPNEIFTRARRWIPPVETKDLNDWIKAAGRDVVRKALI